MNTLLKNNFKIKRSTQQPKTNEERKYILKEKREVKEGKDKNKKR